MPAPVRRGAISRQGRLGPPDRIDAHVRGPTIKTGETADHMSSAGLNADTVPAKDARLAWTYRPWPIIDRA